MADDAPTNDAPTGRRPYIQDEDLHSVKDLSAAPAELIATARSLAGFQRHAFLFERVDAENHPYLDAFIRDVIVGGEDPAQWMRCRLLLPFMDLPGLVVTPLRVVLSRLQAIEAAGWLRIVPDYAEWKSGSDHIGAPACRRDDVPYNWRPPDGIASVAPSALPTEPVDNVVVAGRRWIASRLARACGPRLQTLTTTNDVFASVGMESERASPDAQAAAQGLLAEQAEEAEGGLTRVPGFAAPDPYYLDAGD